MNARKVKIIGMGKYLPDKIVTAEELDKKLGLVAGWTYKKSGVAVRHYVTSETSSQMGAYALKKALEDANLDLKDIDCIIGASGTNEQAIPCNAALIQEQLGKEAYGIPCYDINSTCLSFVTAFDTISFLVDSGRYNRVAIVSSEIPSVGLNWEQKESCVLFGDGAVAAIIEKSEGSSKIVASSMETYSEGAHHTEVRGGGTKIHPRKYSEETKTDFQFDMNGKEVFKISLRIIDGFMDKLLSEANLKMEDIDFVVPHQASGMAMRMMRKRLNIAEEKFVDIIENHGNMISASIPMALYENIKLQKIKRGAKVMLIGTSAGLSIGGLIFEY